MKQFFKAIDHIEQNLSEEITLRQVASIACYSEYHFSRMFHAMTGDTLSGYIRKRRMSHAAERIMTSDVRLIDLAFECGFESQAAFTRAFKKHFGMTPGSLARQFVEVRHQFCPVLTPNFVDHLKQGITMEPEIKNFDTIRVAGLAQEINQFQTSTIPQLWQRLGPVAGDIPYKTNRAAYGVCYDWRGDEGKDTFTYLAGVDVSSLEDLPDGVEGIELTPQTYAVFTHKVTTKDLPGEMKETMKYIWGTWLPNSEYEFAEVPDFELYDERFDPIALSGEFDICIPVRRK